MDIDGSKLSFQLGIDYDNYINNTVNRTEVSTSYQQLMTVQLKIKNGHDDTQLTLSFDEENYFFISAYTLDPVLNDGSIIFYDNPVFENLTSVPGSPSPIINSITAIATAGTGTIVIIEGENFGISNFPSSNLVPSNHQVRFKNADYQGSGASVPIKRIEYCKHLNNGDYISWTPTRIEIRLPAFIHHMYYSQSISPGSGRFYVRNDWGKETLSSSSQTINIQYGLSARKENSLLKAPIHIPRNNCVDGLKFYVDPALKTNASAMSAIKVAFQTWSDALGIVMDFEKDASGNILTSTGSAIDGKNVIYYSNATSYMSTNKHNSGAAPTGLFNCGNNYGNTISGLKDVDITINNTLAWNYNMTGGSISGSPFYDAILHELGHALGLTHSLEPNDLMNPTIIESPSASQRRTLTSGSGYALLGLQEQVTRSINSTWTCSGLETLLSPPSPDCPYGRIGSTFDNPFDIGSLSIGSNYTDTQDNSPANNFGNEYSGPNNQTSDDIFYKFTLSSNSDVVISLCGSGLSDTYLHLLDAVGNRIKSNNNYCDLGSQISKTLTSGTY